MKRPLSFLLVLLSLASSAIGANSGVRVTAYSDNSHHFDVSFSSDLASLSERATVDSQLMLTRTMTVLVPPMGAVSVGNVVFENRALIQGTLVGVRSSSVPMVSVSEPFQVRGRRFVNLFICPVYGDSISTTVAFDLLFDGGHTGASFGSPDPIFDEFLSKSTPNYAAGRDWKVGATRDMSAHAQVAGPFGMGAVFVKMIVRDNGVYRVTGAMLQAAGISLANLASDSIRMFNGGGLQNEFLNSRPRPLFSEIPVSVMDGGDGRIDGTDQIIFVGESLNRFKYAAHNDPKYVSHHYASDNVYWLAVGGSFSGSPLRMSQIDGSVTGTYDWQATQGRRFIHIEQDSILSVAVDGHLTDYYEWYWSSATPIRLFVPTPGIMPSATSSIGVGALTSFGSPNGYVTTRVNGVIATTNCNPGGCTGTTTALTTGLNQVDLALSPLNPGTAPPFFNWLEFGYPSSLTPLSDNLDILLDSVGGRAQIMVNDQFSAAPTILLAHGSNEVSIVSGAQRSASVVTFEAPMVAGGPNRLFMASSSQLKSPVSLALASPSDLRSNLSQADLIIVTAPQFVSALGEYVTYRATSGRVTKIVTVGDIMDNFSWGVYDPTAIRDFLKFAYENWTSPAPLAVLFVGDANFDYLNHQGAGEPNYVPSYNMPISFDSRGGDDNYVYFGNYGLLDSDTSHLEDRGFDMMTARWPVKTAAEIRGIVAKVKQYESGGSLGAWRKNVVSVADDEYADNDDTQGFHVTDALALERGYVPRNLHLQRIYEWDYPLINRERPAVNDALVAAINKGALVLNYVGHGNPDVWAHERVLRRTTDLSRLNNDGRLPLIYAASCDINHFDDPRRESMGEDFLAMGGRGAIGVIAAQRLVYSFDNAALSKEVYRYLLGDSAISICEALFAGKLARQYTGGTPFSRANDRAYLLFGDPFLKLGKALLDIQFDERPDSLVALGVQTVSGRVVDQTGSTVGYDGQLTIDIYDSDRPRSHTVAGTGQVVDYTVNGPSIYQGTVAISSGRFSFKFVTPLDVNFGGRGARIELYAVVNSSIDALGLVDSLAIRNTAAPSTDSAGPTISYAVAGRSNFMSGDHVSRADRIQITLTDSSGINLASGLGHGITVEVDGQASEAANLSTTFTYDAESYTTGNTSFPLASLDPGEHSLKIKAWDNANNFAVSILTVKVVTAQEMAIEHLLNYPNPMAERTTFYFELTNPAERFTLEIFTLAGRRIRTIEQMGLSADNYPNGAVSIDWDGRDLVGDRVATGVYIYKATALPQSGGKAVESFGKVVVVN